MIIVHFFLRKFHGKTLLMADSSATENSEPLWGSAEVICGADETSEPERWMECAKAHVLAGRPDLEYVRTMKPRKRRNGACQMFDMLFSVKEANDGKDD